MTWTRWLCHTRIKLRTETWYDEDNNRMEAPETRMIDTTIGRVIFNNALTESMRFYNTVLEKGGVKDLIAEVYEVCGQEETCIVADRIKEVGFCMQPVRGRPLLLPISLFPHEEGNCAIRTRICGYHQS
jgi:DNA-directed RNA polymerase subunit beta'